MPAEYLNYTSAYFSGELEELKRALSLKEVSSGANLMRLVPYDEGLYYKTRELKSLVGKKGFLQAFSDECFPDQITDGLGEKFRVSLIGLKSYCCCGTSSTTLDAVSQILDEHHILAAEIKEIITYVTPNTFRMTGSIVEPDDIASARFSGRFGVALRCVKGGNTFKEYCEENLRDPEVLELTRKTECILDDGMGTPKHGQNPARVIISLKNGTRYEKKVDAAKGSILNPMTRDEVYGKFRQFASAAFDQHNEEAICETVAVLDSLHDISELVRLLLSPEH